MKAEYPQPSDELVEVALDGVRRISTFRKWELAVVMAKDILPRESYVPVMPEMIEDIGKTPEAFPPIIVAPFGDTLMVVDGHHRLGAFLGNNMKAIWAIVVTGPFSMVKWKGRSDPWWYAG